MIEKKTVSQCLTADYCSGWNDAVDSVVRCKDCKYCRPAVTSEEKFWCKKHQVFPKETDFCSYGERKADE